MLKKIYKFDGYKYFFASIQLSFITNSQYKVVDIDQF